MPRWGWWQQGSDTACFRGSCCETLRSTWSHFLQRFPPIAKSRSRRNRARRHRASREPSLSARKTGSARHTKANRERKNNRAGTRKLPDFSHSLREKSGSFPISLPRRCCFRSIQKTRPGQSRPRFACVARYFMIPISKARMRTTATRSRATESPGLRYLPVGSS